MKLTKTPSGHKFKFSKKEWEDVGKKAGWIKIASVKIYQDNNRTLELSGQEVLDPNLKYDATIRDNTGTIEAVITNTSLQEIYVWAKEHNFDMKKRE